MPSPLAPSRPLGARPHRRELGAAIGLTFLAAAGLLAPSMLPGPAQAQTPDRIVAVGGVITEVLYALGLQDRIVGVDTTSQFPPEALRDKASVGYVRALSAEGVLSLKPSLVIALEGAGPPGAVSLLNEAGLRLASIPEDNSPDGVVTKIQAIGAVAGAAEPAARLAQQTKLRFDELQALRSSLPAKKRVLFVLSLQNGRVLVGGRNSSADAIIQMAGGVNAATAVEGFKPLNDEAIIAAAPDVILMMRNSNSHNASPDDVFAMPTFSQTPAAAKMALIRMDGLYLLGFGPRTPAAARDLMAALYPEAAIPPLKTAAAP
ncbi:hemin ABC transporter substrate-binding protein [Bosea sp. BIWAKO-01]|uniref:heme/hemin ABC transporter substrate-binding protein n=1 Tax=Bosea sp. BIWAKO-01 TaxID=506668 RepID=UPI00086F1EE5|nr:ABC transporter substrate-binding protein [Bosea sp. BIWAKO-01]GAU82311.1 periplasmic hemin-binding protein [Bosea sp. BIWAKO-01]